MTFLSVAHQLENVRDGCVCLGLCLLDTAVQCVHTWSVQPVPLQGWLQPELCVWANVWSGMSQLELSPPYRH